MCTGVSQPTRIACAIARASLRHRDLFLPDHEEFQTWLAGSPDEAFALAREYAPAQMRIVQEGFDKEDLLLAS